MNIDFVIEILQDRDMLVQVVKIKWLEYAAARFAHHTNSSASINDKD